MQPQQQPQQHVLGGEAGLASCRLVDVPAQLQGYELPRTMALYRRQKDEASVTTFSAVELVALPSLSLRLALERPLPPTLLRRRLWYKYSKSPLGPASLSKRKELFPGLYYSYALQAENQWKAYWQAKRRRGGEGGEEDGELLAGFAQGDDDEEEAPP